MRSASTKASTMRTGSSLRKPRTPWLSGSFSGAGAASSSVSTGPGGLTATRLALLVVVRGVLGRVGDRSRRGGRELAALFDARAAAASFTEVIELRATHPALGVDLELSDGGRVDRERPLHADAEGDLADRERLLEAAALTPDHDALEDLDALAVPLHDADVHLHGVARPEIRQVVTEVGTVDEVGLVHGGSRDDNTGPRISRGVGPPHRKF